MAAAMQPRGRTAEVVICARLTLKKKRVEIAGLLKRNNQAHGKAVFNPAIIVGLLGGYFLRVVGVRSECFANGRSG